MNLKESLDMSKNFCVCDNVVQGDGLGVKEERRLLDKCLFSCTQCFIRKDQILILKLSIKYCFLETSFLFSV